MWESISTVLTGKTAVYILVFLFLIILLSLVAIKKGWIHIKTKTVKIGIADKERNIIATQINKTESAITTFYTENGFDKEDYKARFICSEVEDVLYKRIAINHMTTEPVYISLRQAEVWKIICQYSDKVDDSLKLKIFQAVEKLIKELVEIREFYK